MTVKAAVFVGRFQPFHKGHLRTLNNILDKYDQVVVVLGTHNSLRTTKDPWVAIEREEMIRRSLRTGDERKIRFYWQEDRPGDNAKWASEIISGVRSHIWSFTEDVKITLTGCYKDESSFYLKLFPEWAFAPEGIVFPINATDVRKKYFGGAPEHEWGLGLPFASFIMLRQFKETNLFRELVKTGE